MAPKNKFTREEMVQAALQVVRAGGIGSLTAKTLADALVRPTLMRIYRISAGDICSK